VTAICLTGMHRSGTSLTASWLAACGLPIHNGNLIGAEHGNPRGHHEDADFVQLQSDTVDLLEPGARSWQVLHQRPLRLPSDKLDEARRMIADRDAKYPLWAWKDPRSVLFLDQWAELIPDLRVLFVWRPAAPVVASLCRRAKYATNPTMLVTPASATRLWHSYSRRVVQWRRRHPTDSILVSLDDVMADDTFVLDLMAKRWGVELNPFPVAEMVDNELQRHRTAGLVHVWSRTAGRLTRSGFMERQLLGLSDRPGRRRR
jgi:hypothetical protein